MVVGVFVRAVVLSLVTVTERSGSLPGEQSEAVGGRRES